MTYSLSSPRRHTNLEWSQDDGEMFIPKNEGELLDLEYCTEEEKMSDEFMSKKQQD